MSRVVLGTSAFGAMPEGAVFAVCDAALEHGIMTFDTSVGYRDGASSRMFGSWVRERRARDRVVIVDKGGAPRGDARGLAPELVLGDIERSRRELQTDAIDVFCIDRDEPDMPTGGALVALNAALDRGHVWCIGASNWTADRIAEANAYASRHGITPLFVTNPHFGLLAPRRAPIRRVVSLCGAQGAGDRAYYARMKMPVLAWSALAAGALPLGNVPSLDALKKAVNPAVFEAYGGRENLARARRTHELAAQRGVSAATVALAWVLGSELDARVIVRTSRPEHVRDAAAATRLALSAEERAWLERGDDRARDAEGEAVARVTSPETRRARSEKTYDAIVVGAGPAGTWAAKELTEGGLEVLLVDAAPEREPIELDVEDGRALLSRARLRDQQRVQQSHPRYLGEAAPLYVDDTREPYLTGSADGFAWIRTNAVGGRAHVWDGSTLRFAERHFRGDASAGMPAWPLTYAELAPFYAHVERFLGVAGTPEALSEIPDGEYSAALELSTGEAHVKSHAERELGCRVVPVRGIATERVDEERAWVGSMASVLEAARSTGKLTVAPETVVRELALTEGDARARGVVCVDPENRVEYTYRAKVVVLCAGTIGSTRILMQSRRGQGSNALGRFLMAGPHIAAFVHTRRRFAGFDDDRRHLMGATFMVLPRLEEKAGATPIPHALFGSIARDERSEGLGGWFIARGEMKPSAANGIRFDDDERDACDRPLLRIRCALGESERAALAVMRETIDDVALHAAFAVDHPVNVGVVGALANEVGSARMGDDAKTAVLDPQQRVWDTPNVYVADGAAFPSAPYVDPTHTIMALAVRVAQGIAARAKRGEL